MSAEPWPHAPPHWLFGPGTYFVTASTFHKRHRFDSPEKLDAVMNLLIGTATEFEWNLRAWALFSNHYHFLAKSPEDGSESLRTWLKEFHRRSAIRVNEIEGVEGRRVWMNFRETLITHQTSYMARLNYVNQNPVRHGLVKDATHYRWCSAGWFEKCASPAFVKSVGRFKIDKLNVEDDYEF
jgi:putative transposase